MIEFRKAYYYETNPSPKEKERRGKDY